MCNNKITFREGEICIEDAKNILDAYFDSKDPVYKKGLEEITPFEGNYFKNGFCKLVSYFGIRKFLSENSGSFIYRLALIKKIVKPIDGYFYLKGFVDGHPKLFFLLKRDSIKNKKHIFIDKIISIQRGIGRQSIQDICDHYGIYKIVVEPSDSGYFFWEKMQQEYRGSIYITIKMPFRKIY